MTTPTLRRHVLALAVLALPAAAYASRSSTISLPPTQKLTPEQEAARAYNDGLEYADKADKLGMEAAAETEAAKKEKLVKKSLGKYADAADKFAEATKKNPKLFQAWGSLGYAYRKGGKYKDALAAYDKSLELQPGYTPAIEYRAEAYLELDRLDDVKEAYMFLFRNDRPRANELDGAIQKWLEKRKGSPGTLDQATFDSFSAWAAERHQLASQTSELLLPSRARW
jgi:tetratricopeptide (TPR) repeat protein